MRSLIRRSVNRPRPVLLLETLEDRRVMSAGGLFSALQPLAIVETPQTPVSSVFTSALSSVSTTVHNLGEVVLAGPVKTLTGEVPTQAAGIGVHLDLNVDALFLHVENLRLDVGLGPVGSGQPLLALAVGAKVGVGSAGNELLNLAPNINLGVGGSNVLSVGAGVQAGTPSGPVLDAHAGAGNQTGLTASVNLPGIPTGAGAALLTSAGNLGNANNAVNSNSPVALPAAIFGAPISAPLVAAPNAIGVDGGGGSEGGAAFAVLPVTDVSVAEGAAASAVVAPFDLGGGTDTEIVLKSPDLEASGLTTHFQPYGLDGGAQTIRSLLGPRSSWLAAWWARFSYLAPWLAGLIAAGTALEISRRRRAAKVIDQPLA